METKELGRKIALARKHMGHTQESLAEAANLSLSTIQRIEKGKVRPRAHSIHVLSDVLGLDTSEIHFSDKTSEIISFTLFWMAFFSLILSFIPLLNSLIPLQFWMKNRQQRTIGFFAKKIVFFQSISFVLLVIFLLLIPVISYSFTGQSVHGKPNMLLLAYILFLAANIITIPIFYLKAVRTRFAVD